MLKLLQFGLEENDWLCAHYNVIREMLQTKIKNLTFIVILDNHL